MESSCTIAKAYMHISELYLTRGECGPDRDLVSVGVTCYPAIEVLWACVCMCVLCYRVWRWLSTCGRLHTEKTNKQTNMRMFDLWPFKWAASRSIRAFLCPFFGFGVLHWSGPGEEPRDWKRKQRTKKTRMTHALRPHSRISGDPNQWQMPCAVCTHDTWLQCFASLNIFFFFDNIIQ